MLKKIVLTLLLSLSLTACITAKPLEPRPQHWATPINKANNFYQVDKLLFRSERLKPTDMALVKQYGIDTVINLRHESNTNYLAEQNLHLIKQPLKTWAITPEQLAQILFRINHEQKLGKKVLIHCYHGADRTGIVIAMYRIIQQNWTIEQAKQEMLQGGYGYHLIWKNLENLLTDKKVAQTRQAYQQLQTQNNEANFSHY